MQEIEIRKYQQGDKMIWNEFCVNSRNSTFLLMRDYIDYHNDRFDDCSLMIYYRGKLCAMLPANIKNNTLYSHQGLTYGGLIIHKRHIDGTIILRIFNALKQWCSNNNIKHLIYKPIPFIYHNQPTQEDLYALFRMGAQRTICNLSSAIYLGDGAACNFNMSKRQQVRKAAQHCPIISEEKDFSEFWSILEKCLYDRHRAKPVHTLKEIEKLYNNFPDNIRLHTLRDENGLQAGICIYDTGIVAHSQYTASTLSARNNFYVTYLYNYLISEVYKSRRYFDFGTSNAENGKFLDSGLLNQKFSMGATGVIYEIYNLDF